MPERVGRVSGQRFWRKWRKGALGHGLFVDHEWPEIFIEAELVAATALGFVQRHVGAMADKVMRRLKDAGLGRDVSDLFSEATLLWRREAKAGSNTTSVATHLIGRTRAAGAASAEALLDLVEALSIAERRQTARSFAQIATQEAA